MERWRRVRTWETGDGSEHSRALPLAARMPLASSLWPGVPAAPQRRTFLLRFGVTRYCYCLLLLALACLTEFFWFDCDVSYSYIPKGQRASASDKESSSSEILPNSTAILRFVENSTAILRNGL